MLLIASDRLQAVARCSDRCGIAVTVDQQHRDARPAGMRPQARLDQCTLHRARMAHAQPGRRRHALGHAGALHQRIDQIHRLEHARLVRTERGHAHLPVIAALASPAELADALAQVFMPLIADAGLVAPPLTELRTGDPKLRERAGQHRQVAVAQQLDVDRQIADPMDGLAVQGHQVVAQRQQIRTPREHATRLTDEIDGVVGQKRHQLRPVDQHVVGKREAGGQNVRQRLPVVIDAHPSRRCHRRARVALDRLDQLRNAIGLQHIVVMQELDVLALRQANPLDFAAELAKANWIAEIADRKRTFQRMPCDALFDQRIGTVVADDQFEPWVRLQNYAPKRFIEIAQLVGRHHDADKRIVGGAIFWLVHHS